ncbi:protein DpdD [Mesorhizobium sp.]|uniref:protein DpdD n=1 Tax=Mesorhizobium sp. TaxID=1871066 RepID=UPI000FE6EC0F|nr:protein DpdD [Mesorhizobium sp.]RWC47183.1 MAG: hypothetical protein EOS28_02065 [Mesorhizobium sp.]RWE94398.1 MAG: hypothetical protein EOS68_21585 [Mesorhizobium sp.]
MIGTDGDASRHALADISAINSFGGLDAELAALCVALCDTIADPGFPGALIPTVVSASDVRVLVVAPTVGSWRRLKPVLVAFAGPTLSSFEGIPEALGSGHALFDRVAQTEPAVSGVMRLSEDRRVRLTALRALIRARDTLARAPDLQRTAPVPSSWLLARFQDYLNVGRRAAAMEILERLRSELRLDSLNLKFLQVQLHATFAEWQAIVDLSGFASLCLARRTPAITSFLLEAVYHTHLAQPFDAHNVAETRRRYEDLVRPLARPMLTPSAPATLTSHGWRIYGLEALMGPDRTDIAELLRQRSGDVGWISDLLPVPSAHNESVIAPDAPLDIAREALMRVDAIDSNDLLADARAALARLSPEERALLREADPFRPSMQIAEGLEGVAPPASWVDWLGRAADPTFMDALDVARQATTEWVIDATAGDPVAVQALAAALDRAQLSDLAAERTAQALPYLVAWLQRDPDFPRAAMTPIYASLLTLFALSRARGSATYDSSQVLINALLSGGLDSKAYKALIADINEIAGDGFGIDMIYWVFEIVEDFLKASAPDASAREDFFHGVLARVAPIYGRLSSLQQSAVGQLAAELGWNLQSLGVNQGRDTPDIFAIRIQDMRIAIYSLTESSARQAKAALEQASTNVTVDTNADHGGTARLRALAENADLFVMTWLSAKHAATDFIREHRGSRPLIYAQGRGFSSILRAIEDHIGGSSTSGA